MRRYRAMLLPMQLLLEIAQWERTSALAGKGIYLSYDTKGPCFCRRQSFSPLTNCTSSVRCGNEHGLLHQFISGKEPVNKQGHETWFHNCIVKQGAVKNDFYWLCKTKYRRKNPSPNCCISLKLIKMAPLMQGPWKRVKIFCCMPSVSFKL